MVDLRQIQYFNVFAVDIEGVLQHSHYLVDQCPNQLGLEE